MSQKYTAMIPNALSEVTVVGRVTRDADTRFTPSGTKVANVSIAISRRYNKDGEWQETTSFLSLAIWGDAADRAQNIRKGDIVAATFSMADLEARPYESQGEAKAALQVGRAQISRVAWAGDNGTVNEPAMAAAEGAPIPTEDDIPF